MSLPTPQSGGVTRPGHMSDACTCRWSGCGRVGVRGRFPYRGCELVARLSACLLSACQPFAHSMSPLLHSELQPVPTDSVMVAIGSRSFAPTTALREDPAVLAASAARVEISSDANCTIQRQERQPCHDAREPSRVQDACEPSRIPLAERDLASTIARSACSSPTALHHNRRHDDLDVQHLTTRRPSHCKTSIATSCSPLSQAPPAQPLTCG